MTQTSIYNFLYIHSNSPETLYKNVQNKNFRRNRVTFVVLGSGRNFGLVIGLGFSIALLPVFLFWYSVKVLAFQIKVRWGFLNLLICRL